MSKHMRFFLSKLKVFQCFFFFFFFVFFFVVVVCCCFFVLFFVNLDKQTLDTGVLRKKNYSLFLDCTLI